MDIHYACNKKEDCADYRELLSQCLIHVIIDEHPIPKAKQIFNEMKGAKVF